MKKYITKDSGKRQTYKSGMNRDIQEGKPRFDLLLPENQKYSETLLYRWAMLMERGAKKYNARNWEKANSIEELERAKASCYRHFIQAMQGEDDEDHFAGIIFNLNTIIYLMDKLKVNINGSKRKNDNE